MDLPQDSKARSAAATAAFTSSRLETGARPTHRFVDRVDQVDRLGRFQR
ncbi:hypothetical protein I541_5685 [Mycobacteroides abscessus]|nr:hypothetical protein I541_5685 [Mycobacteroides abscessus]